MKDYNPKKQSSEAHIALKELHVKLKGEDKEEVNKIRKQRDEELVPLYKVYLEDSTEDLDIEYKKSFR